MIINHKRNYQSYELNKLLLQLDKQAQQINKDRHKKVQLERNYQNSCGKLRRSQRYQKEHPFNNKTKEGSFFQDKLALTPYVFIPKYKNETFIMPDRIFEKGQSAKRLFVKMKDSSVYSFREPENSKINQVIKKEKKQKIIDGRKMEELNRILDENDGRIKATINKENLINTKIFCPTSTVPSVFDQTQPMLQPRQSETHHLKKTSLNKTFGPNKWRPGTRGEGKSNSSLNWGLKTGSMMNRSSSHRS